MPYLNDTSETDWCKQLFDKLRTVENKLDQLLVLQEQSVDTTVRPPLIQNRLSCVPSGTPLTATTDFEASGGLS